MMAAAPTIREATAQDTAKIGVLLESSGLPTSDLAASCPQFVVACNDNEVVGAGALEIHGNAALLRSLAVASDLRGRGLGRTIVEHLEKKASATRIKQLVLLTQTAEVFFERLVA